MKKCLLNLVGAFALLGASAAVRVSSPEAAPADAHPRYDLEIKLAPEAHRIEVAGTVGLPAAAETRARLRLSLLNLMRDFAVEVVEPRESAGPAKVERDGAAWVVTPVKPLAAGAPVVLRISYAGETASPAGIFFVGEEGSFASGTNVPWYPQFDGARGTGLLRFSLPAGYVAHASGSRRSTDVEAARGSSTFESGEPVFFSFAAARYRVYRREGRIPVSVYLLRPRADADEYLEGCAKILEVLAREFGDYAHAAFALVEVPQGPADKANYAGASVDGFILAATHFLDVGFNLAYYGHEIGHQWWGNTVRVTGPRGGYLLSEGMAQYGSLRAVEEIEGAAAAESYRRTGYPGYIFDQNALGYLTLAAAGLDHTLADLHGGWVSHQLANSKGFLALDALSRETGRDTFRRALHDFTRRGAERTLTWDDFRASVEKAAGRNLGWFFAQWFERAGAPEWSLTWAQNECGEVSGSITQAAPFYRARLEVETSGDNGRRASQRVEVSGARTNFRLSTGFCVRDVVLDPHYEVLRWTPEYRTEASALAPFQRGLRQIPDSRVLARESFRKALKDVPADDRHGLRFMLEYGIAFTYARQSRWAEAREHIESALALPRKRAERLSDVYMLLAQAAEALDDEKLLARALEGAVAADAAAGGRAGAAREARSIRERIAAEGMRKREDQPTTDEPHVPPSPKGNTTFTLKGFEDARTVVLAASFNGWSTSQTVCGREEGVWVCRVDLAPGKYQYKFVVDGEWIKDPDNPRTEADADGNVNSVRVVRAK